jgi:DNA-binding Lrp family transcriptional regulator
LPGLSLALFLGTLRESRAAPRALLWSGITMGMMVSVTLFAIIGPAGNDTSTPLTSIFSFCCCSPIFLIPGGLALFFAVKSWSQLRNALAADRAQRTLELLSARGEASFSEIGRELSLTEQQVERLLHEWADAGRIIAITDPDHRRVYTPVALIEKYRQVESIVQARGQIFLTDLEDELQVPRDKLHLWVRMLARKGNFSGYVDWEEGLLSSLQVDELKDWEHCPHCGGETNLVGKGIIHCTYCNVDIFFSTDTLPASKEPAQLPSFNPQEASPLLFSEPHLARAAAQRTPFKRLRELFKPNRRARIAINLILLIYFLVTACSLSFLFTELSGNSAYIIQMAQGLFLLPLLALLMALAAFLDHRNPPRALLSSLATLILGLGGLIVAMNMAFDPDAGIETGVFSIIVLLAPLMLVFSLPAIYFGAKSWPEVQAVLRLQTSKRVLELIQVRGAVSFTEISQKLMIEYNEVDDLVDDLLQSGELYGTMDAQRGWVYSAQNLEEKRIQLLASLQERGQIGLEEMAHQLQIPMDLLESLIYQLVQASQFSGYINWEQGLLYSVAARKLEFGSQCPNCGGILGLAGDIIECQHCGSELLRG